MSTEFNVDLEELDQLIGRLTGLSGYVSDHLDEVAAKAANVQRVWEATAAQAFRDAHREWDIGARDFADGVAKMTEAAKHAHGRYTRAVATNRRMLQGE